MINVAVEGESDREVAKSVVREAGWSVNRVVVAGGKAKLDPRIPNYNRAAAQFPWVVFRDSDAQCPVTLRAQLGQGITTWDPRFSLRIAHSMSEAWLLSDPETFSAYFGVGRGRVPADPEALAHAKHTLLGLCAQSRSRAIRQDITAPSGEVGPLYVSRINDYAATLWRPSVAAGVSQSLERAIRRLRELPRSSVAT